MFLHLNLPPVMIHFSLSLHVVGLVDFAPRMNVHICSVCAMFLPESQESFLSFIILKNPFFLCSTNVHYVLLKYFSVSIS